MVGTDFKPCNALVGIYSKSSSTAHTEMTTADNKSLQEKRLRTLLTKLSSRKFFGEILRDWDQSRDLWDQFRALPFQNKSDLITAGGVAAVCDLPPDQYVRWHQTSGTKGHPMVVRDTAADWQWWMQCWRVILDAADITAADIALMAFSFGPFIGFWSANDALIQRSTTVIPGGGLSSLARVNLLMQQKCTVLFTTPTYAMRLAEVAAENGIDLRRSHLRRIIVAGEPGGSIPEVRGEIENTFDAVVIDHAGGSEVGPWGYGTVCGDGLHIIENQFVAEVIDFSGDQPRWIERENIVGQTGELVLTPLGRIGCPVLRYRTGDIVKPSLRGDNDDLFLERGVLGRADDMVVIRGVNIFPSSVESIIREISPRSEFRVTLGRRDGMDAIAIELEDDVVQAKALEDLLTSRLAMRVPVRHVADHSLPRFDAKSRRWIDQR